VEKYQIDHPAPGAPGPSQEGVHPGPITAPAAPAKPEADLAAIPVTAEELEVGATLFGMSKKDIQIQKKEVADWKVRAGGVIGLKKMGGTPICSYADIGLPEPTTLGGE